MAFWILILSCQVVLHTILHIATCTSMRPQRFSNLKYPYSNILGFVNSKAKHTVHYNYTFNNILFNRTARDMAILDVTGGRTCPLFSYMSTLPV